MSALARWDAFLAQVAGRHRGVRTEAAARAIHAVTQLATGGDHRPLLHELAAVDRRLRELEKKIADTWREHVEAAIAAEGHDARARAAAREKGLEIQRALDDERQMLPIRALTDLARQRHKHAATRPELLASAAEIENEVRRLMHTCADAAK